MSYLLDALNKSRGEPNSVPSDNSGQPVSYAQTGFAPSEGVNVYKWISIALALILTLLIGIFVGNRYALFSVSNQPTPVQASVPTQPQAQTPKEQKVQQEQAETVTKPAESKTPDTAVQKEAQVAQTQTEKPVETQIVKSQTVAASETEEAPIIVGYIPDNNKPAQNNRDLNSSISNSTVSSDLLSRFNEAIKESENVSGDFEQSQPEDYAVEEYLTKSTPLAQLELSEQLRVPGFTYDTHLYASDPQERRVKLNGSTFMEKEWISDEVQIYEIQRQFLIFEMGHIRFSVPALEDWQDVAKR